MKERNEYTQVLKSGMFWEFYPTLSGNWSEDNLKWLTMKGIITNDTSLADKLKIILDNETDEEFNTTWNEIKKYSEIGTSAENYINTLIK